MLKATDFCSATRYTAPAPDSHHKTRIATAILLNLIMFWSESVFAEPYPVQTLSREDGSSIHYYLISAKDAPSDTLLLLLQGSDCNSITQGLDTYQPYGLVSSGADLLMIEKYGLTAELLYRKTADPPEYPTSYLLNDRPSQRLSDAIQVLEQLKNTYRRIIVMGGSEGAVITARVCEVYTVTACVLLNGGGRWFTDDVVHNIRVTEVENAEEQAAEFLGFAKYILHDADTEAIVSNHGPDWWRESLNTDLQQLIQNRKAPLLMLQSQEDTQVDVDAAIQLARETESDINPRVFEFRLLPGLDHSLINDEGDSQTEAIIPLIRHWLSAAENNG